MALTPFVDDLSVGAGGLDFERDMRHMNHLMSSMMKNLPIKQPGLHSMHDRSAIEPQIVDGDNGQKMIKWHFDLTGFRPEDVHLKTMGDKLEVRAKCEEKSEHHVNAREVARIVALPSGIEIDKMKSRLSHRGILTIEAPFTPPTAAIEHHRPQHHDIAIKHDKHGTAPSAASHKDKDNKDAKETGQHSIHQSYNNNKADLNPQQAAIENSKKASVSQLNI